LGETESYYKAKKAVKETLALKIYPEDVEEIAKYLKKLPDKADELLKKVVQKRRLNAVEIDDLMEKLALEHGLEFNKPDPYDPYDPEEEDAYWQLRG
jgi:hypothetical protein